ncbi:MAG: Ig-like domain-containing protein [Muribaculaceae bacterium]|nr:Ig-like domain-containing protein [Muribaculaceae bacterium]
MRDARCKMRNAIVLMLMALLVQACANIGSPEGGPRDYTPPVAVKMSPEMGAVNFKGNKVEITFNEIVNIKDQQKKVVVSPVQHDMPLIRAMGKKVTVEFRDTMKPETTYVIDFSNAIEDNNEGNQLDGFAFTFSTGPEIDTLRMSGIVLNASNLEPAQHILVGLHTNLNDTAFTHLPLERITRTNDRGQFTIMGLKPGKYHVFALNDIDGNYRMARTEDIAFANRVYEPSVTTFESMDTIFTFDHKVDTVMHAVHTDFLPNNVLLSLFNEHYQSLYLKTSSRPSPNKLHLLFGAAVDSLPQLEILRPAAHAADWYRLERTARSDSLTYWLTDSTLIKSDTITVAARYQRVDSTDHVVWYQDTIHFAYIKPPYLRKQEEEVRKDREQKAKRLQELRDKQAKGQEVDAAEIQELEKESVVPKPKLKMDFVKKGTLEVYDTIKVKFDTPINSWNDQAVKLEMKHDSLWTPLPAPAFVPQDEYDLMTYSLPMSFEPDSSYRIIINAGAVTSVYGLPSDSIGMEFKVKALEEYANLQVRVNVRDSAFVELLDGSDKPVRQAPVVNGVVDFENVLPATYYMRLTLDTNGNGRWDTGNYAQHLQPEEVYYYPQPVKLRRNWDVDQQWNIYATALDLQKPEAIRKNKPEQKKNAVEQKKKKNGTDEEEDEDEFNSSGFANPSYSGNKYDDFQRNRNNR